MRIKEAWIGTASERDTIAHAKQLTQKKRLSPQDQQTAYTAKKLSRGIFVRRTAMVVSGLGLLGIGAFVLGRRDRELSLAKLLEQIKNPVSVIQNEVKRLGVQQNAQETNHWSLLPVAPRAEKVPLDEILRDPKKIRAVEDTLNTVFEAMDSSKNLFFSSAIQNIRAMIADSDLSMVISPSLHQKREDIAVPFFASSHFDRQLNKFFWALQSNPYEVYNNADGGLFACGLAHENEHLQNDKKRLYSIDSESWEKKYKALVKRITTEYLLEETRGYAVGAQAYVHHAGLTNELSIPGNSLIRRSLRQDAAAFILTGNNHQNPLWIKYVEWKIRP